MFTKSKLFAVQYNSSIAYIHIPNIDLLYTGGNFYADPAARI